MKVISSKYPEFADLEIDIDDWELIVSGEASQSPYHQWECAYYLGHSEDKKMYALLVKDFRDPETNNEEDEDWWFDQEITVIILDAKTEHENRIVNELIKAHLNNGGKQIDFYHEMGRFNLEDF